MTTGNVRITLDDDADYVQNAVHDGTLRLIDPRDNVGCEEEGSADYGLCGGTAFVALPSDVMTKQGQRCRDQAFCLHCAADYLRSQNYGNV